MRDTVLVMIMAASLVTCSVSWGAEQLPAAETAGTAADAGRPVRAGYLTCHVAGGVPLRFGSSRNLVCAYAARPGHTEYYSGSISRFGADIGYKESGVIMWSVLAPTKELGKDALMGQYGGATASAALGVGSGPPILIGGSKHSIALAPVSIEGQNDMNIAAGVVALSLTPTKMYGEAPQASLTPVPTGEKGPSSASPSPTWNAWAEQDDYEPVKWLKIGGKYRFAIDLSLWAYKRSGQKTFHQPISGDLSDLINKSTKPSVRVTILFLPDPAFFNSPPDSERSKEVTLDLEKLRRAEKTRLIEPADAFKELKDGKRDFVISSNDTGSGGRTFFALVAKDQTDREGWSHVGVSIWATKDENGGETPVDEFSVPLCVVESEDRKNQLCAQEPPSQPVFRGLRAATEEGPVPSAALHFVDLGAAPVFGIFHRNDRPNAEFKVWAIDESFQELVTHLEDLRTQYSVTSGPNGLNGEELEQQLRNEGASMYNALLKPGAAGADAARNEFEAFALPDLTAPPNPTTSKSIFVRMMGNPPVNLMAINLLALPIGEGRSELLGLHFRIEQPLEEQSYLPSPRCISRWMVVMPDANTAHNNGLEPLRASLGKWPAKFQSAQVEDGSDMRKLRCFVSRRGAEPATALVIMSHQGGNAVWFKTGKTLDSDAVQVKFDEPSLVILDGCDTAKPESWGFIGKFNRKGAMTSIATATEISSSLASDFVTCFVKKVANGARDVGDAYWQSLLCLETVNDDHPAWGSRALTFLLLGNPYLQLCSPTAAVPTSGDCQ